MKLSNGLLIIAISIVICLNSCSQSTKNIVTGSMSSNIMSGNNCIAVSYNKAVVISGGNFIGTNTNNCIPLMVFSLLNYQSNAPFTYTIDGEISHFNTLLYETATDTFSGYQGWLTINTIVPTITGTFSVSMTKLYPKDSPVSNKDTLVASGTFIAPGL